jgi:5'-nucleotidase
VKILLSNDDGVLAPGLTALRRTLAPLGEVIVVAPQSPQSAASHAVTISDPIHVSAIVVNEEFPAFSVKGRPADCVKVALSQILRQKPDMVVSGINDGANASSNVLYSGTVAAAAEGAFLGIPSFAVSLQRSAENRFDTAARIAGQLIEFVYAQGVQPGRLININIPPLSNGLPKGVRVTRQGSLHILDQYQRLAGPDGKDYYWLSGDFDHLRDSEGSDLQALQQGYVAVTPLQFDLTHFEQLDRMGQWSWPDLQTAS